jgi:hypothetical protein
MTSHPQGIEHGSLKSRSSKLQARLLDEHRDSAVKNGKRRRLANDTAEVSPQMWGQAEVQVSMSMLGEAISGTNS